MSTQPTVPNAQSVWATYKSNRQAALDAQYATDLAAWKAQCASYDAYYAAWPPDKRVGIDPPPMPPAHMYVSVDLVNLTEGQATVTESPRIEEPVHVLPPYVAPATPAPSTPFPGTDASANSDALTRIEAKLDRLMANFGVK
jgi:hypothetical protein